MSQGYKDEILHHCESILGGGASACKGPEVGAKPADRKFRTMARGIHEKQAEGELREIRSGRQSRITEEEMALGTGSCPKHR